MKLALIDNSSEHLSDAVSALKLPESDILSIQGDVSNYEDMVQAAKQVHDKFTKVDVLCLNAGISMKGANTWNGNMDAWQKVWSACCISNLTHLLSPQMLNINLFGIVNGSNAFVKSIVDGHGPGLVIVTGSKQGITCPPGNPAYNVSKAGVKAFTEQLAYELREATENRVTAHLLVPGWTFTKVSIAFIGG